MAVRVVKLPGPVVLLLGLMIVLALALSLTVVLSIAAPLVGLAYFTRRARMAAELWRSQGRFPTPTGYRVVPVVEARRMALWTLLLGVGALVLACIPPAILFSGAETALLAFVVGLVLTGLSRSKLKELSAETKGVEVLTRRGG
jgi:hypothetical protein